MKVVIYGAGLTGRGYLPKYLDSEKDDLIFIEKNQRLVNCLKKSGSYSINVPQSNEKIEINHYRIFEFGDSAAYQCISEADFILTAVGTENLTDVAKNIADIQKVYDCRFTIITHENGINPSLILKDSFIKNNAKVEDIHIAQSAVFCSTILDEKSSESLDILSEDLYYYPLEKKENLAVPSFHNTEYITNFEDFLKRKIYTYNCLAAVIGYMGYMKGYTIFSEAANDEEIVQLTDQLLRSLNPSLALYFGVAIDDQIKFAKRAVDKFRDPYISDTVDRNIRDPMRKLQADERLIKPMMIIEESKMNNDVLKYISAVAYIYWKKSVQEENVDFYTFLKVTTLTNKELIADILEYITLIEKSKSF